MEIDELPENDERLLKKPEIKRDEMGRFEQAGTGLIKKSQVIKKPKHGHGGLRAGAGRPRGSKNKISLALKEMILNSLDRVGGEEYLAKLAIENSSAYASLLGKVLPMTLAADGSDNLKVKVSFTRTIVYPNGHREIEGVTPKQLPAPSDAPLIDANPTVDGLDRPTTHVAPEALDALSASHMLPSDDSSTRHTRDMLDEDK